jgi:Domain of unknown function (DUF4129)
VKSASPATRLLAIGLALAVLLGMVAFAVRGHTSPASSGAHNRDASQALANVVFTLWALAMAAGAVLLAYFIATKKKKEPQAFRTRPALVSLMIFALAFAILIAVRSHLGGPSNGRSSAAAQAAQIRKELKKAQRKREATQPGAPTFEWRLAVGIIALIVGVTATAFIRSYRRRKDVIAELTLAQELSELMDETLDDLRNEADPRKAVIAAYARMERILAAHGVPRKPAEAPLEYLSRVLLDLDVSEPAVRRLTRLFERAKFSQHDIDASMKEQAIDALVSIRDDLHELNAEKSKQPVRLDEAPGPAT